MKKKFTYIIIALLAVVILIWYFTRDEKGGSIAILSPVEEGEFRINVTTTGELEAKNSEKIYGPAGLRAVRIWQVKIEDIIPDGTVVDSGDYVATLDRTEISNTMKDVENELEKLESQFTKTKLDTSLEMRNARDELINLKYSMEERQIELEQSKYEPPATIRQVRISMEKAGRAYEQALKNYKLRNEKSKAIIKEVKASLQQAQRKYQQMVDVYGKFTVKAPQSGMVIYKRNWDGKKQGAGATLSSWDNVVATLPDLSKMISKTYVNEIDISKVKIGQDVEIGIDAFPDKVYSGEVIEVANIGQQMRNTNTKVFEVKIVVNEFDTILRPAMTTKNTIITAVFDSVLYLPIESIHFEDTISYVYKTNGKLVKQEVEVGRSNEDKIIIKEGVEIGDEVYLLPPANADKLKLKLLIR
ncbi:MAG: efflux RND transporter periplasmic adaptor subunit [Bacteroidales bacterium]|nr:efflux RND transporter periplasmic adaptor subunit [Bacteroidales bacterium]